MRFVIQRVKEASVRVDQIVTGEIKTGFMVLVGISQTDSKIIADKMIKKLLAMRIFEDVNGKTNLALKEVDGSLLLISQFTLYADCKKGNRPSFIRAGSPNEADQLYQYIIEQCRYEGYHTETGIFGADMKVALINDGPFTVILDSEELF